MKPESRIARFVQAGLAVGSFGERASSRAHAYDPTVYPLGADVSLQARSPRDACPFTP